MKRLTILLFSVALAGGATPAGAQSYPVLKGPSGQFANPPPMATMGVDSVTGLPCLLTQSVTCQEDPNNAAFQGEVALTVGTPDTQVRRSLKATCTVAGNVSVTYGDGSTGIWAAVVGVQTFPIAITTVNSAGTTATCTYANLK